MAARRFWALLLMAVIPAAQAQYPVYGPSAQISSGDDSRRAEQSQPAVQAASGILPPARPVDSVSEDYGRIEGHAVTGVLAFPTHNYGRLPGLLLCPEWWGLNQAVRNLADRLAGEGYVVLVIDPFGGRIAPTARAARQLKQQALSDPAALEDNFRQALAYLKTHLHVLKTGVIGRDFGGNLALRAAQVLGDQLQAGVIWSGSIPADPPDSIGIPLLLLSGDADTISPPAPVQAFAAEQQRRGRTVELHVYPGAGHAFANPDGAHYDAAAAGDAWRRTAAFLAAHLKH